LPNTFLTKKQQKMIFCFCSRKQFLKTKLEINLGYCTCFSFSLSLPVEREKKQFRGEKMKREDVERLEPVEKKGDR